MARRRRGSTPSNLSFLDIMSCGFGAVVLVFLVTKHSMSVNSEEVNEVLLAEVDRIEVEVEEGELDLVQMREALAEAEQRIDEVEAQSAERSEEVEQRRIDLNRLRELTLARQESIEELRSDIDSLEARTDDAEEMNLGDDRLSSALLSVSGEGQRQYLTGLRITGDRILVLFDRSASMLDETIVNIIRRRNMDAARQRAAPKWSQAQDTLRWLAARLPRTSRFQIYTFAETWTPALEGTEDRWLDAIGGRLDEAVQAASTQLPGGGTNLRSVFEAAGRLDPPPDNIILLTDGLPTRDADEPRRGTVSGRERVRLFDEAVGTLPVEVPVNVILLHLEGDPMAASRYWALAVATRGSFLAPSGDWP